MVNVQTGNMLDVVVEGKSIGLKPRGSDEVLWLPEPEGLRDVLATEIAQLKPPVAATPPMCAIHAELDRKDTLVLEVGNDCIACSLHERTALLGLLEPFAADDGSQDSLTVLRNVIASAAISEVAQCAQAVLTALNVGDVQSGSLLHLKLREVMIAYRKRLATTDNEEAK